MSKKTINVEGVRYSISLVNPSELLAVAKQINEEKYRAISGVVGPDGERFAGLCDTHDSTIYVNRNLGKEKVEKTLIHEIIEAIDQECLLGLKHNVIQAITNALYSTGKLNLKEYLEEDTVKKDDSKQRGSSKSSA